MTSEQFFGLYNYWIVICLMMTGFYIVIARKNMIKTVIGLNIFQTSVILLYVTMGTVDHGTAPIIPPHIVAQQAHHDAHSEDHADDHADERNDAHSAEPVDEHSESSGEVAADEQGDAVAQSHRSTGGLVYSNPLPSVLMLTAIVVGIATTAVALSLIVRIREGYGTIEEDEILLLDRES